MRLNSVCPVKVRLSLRTSGASSMHIPVLMSNVLSDSKEVSSHFSIGLLSCNECVLEGHPVSMLCLELSVGLHYVGAPIHLL